MNMSQLYEKDFYQWTVKTANAIKNKAFDKLDIEHLQEEIESMGKKYKKENSELLERIDRMKRLIPKDKKTDYYQSGFK